MASMGGGQIGSMSMAEVSQMMERTATMQKRMAEMMSQSEKK
jgi:hypothetical protein